MIDLTNVPLEDLKAELDRRMTIQREARKAEKQSRKYCKNCAFRFLGRANSNVMPGYETWVCYMRPKEKKNYAGRVPEYNKVYYVCDNSIRDCEMFVHKDTKEGAKIYKKLSKMADRV